MSDWLLGARRPHAAPSSATDRRGHRDGCLRALVRGDLGGRRAGRVAVLRALPARVHRCLPVRPGRGDRVRRRPVLAAVSGLLLGTRNTLYGLKVAPMLGWRGWRRVAAAHLLIDESTAMSITRTTREDARVGFLSTGLSIFVLWNLATLVGALAGDSLGDPRTYGLDAAVGGAFLGAAVAPARQHPQPGGRGSRGCRGPLLSCRSRPVGSRCSPRRWSRSGWR